MSDKKSNVLDLYTHSRTYYTVKKLEIVDAWKRYFQLSEMRAFPGRSNTVSTLTRRAVETIFPRLRAAFMSDGKIHVGTEFHGDPGNVNTEELVEGYMDQKINVDMDIYDQVAMYIKQGIIGGASMMQKYWHKESKTKRSKMRVDVIDILDVYPDPAATSLKDVQDGRNWMIIQELTTFDEIMALVDSGVYDKKVMEAMSLGNSSAAAWQPRDELQAKRGYPIDTSPEDVDPNNEKQREKMLNKTFGVRKDGKIPVLHKWKGMHVETVTGNGNVILRDRKMTGTFPFYMWRYYPSPFDFFGEGVGELLRWIQREATLIRNQRRDMENLNINSMYSVREGADIDFYSLTNPRPGGYVRMGDHDDIRPLVPPSHQAINSTFSDETITHQDADGLLQTSDFNRGTRENPSLTKTASGIESIIGQTTVKITEPESDIARSLSQLAQDLFAEFKGKESTEIVIRKVGREGIKWETITKEELEGEWKFTVKMDLSRGNKELRANRYIQMLQYLIPLSGPGGPVKIEPVLIEILKAQEFPNPETVIREPGPEAPPIPPELENQLLQAGVNPPVHPMDNHPEHIQVHSLLGEVGSEHNMEHFDAMAEGGVVGQSALAQPSLQENTGQAMAANAGQQGGI